MGACESWMSEVRLATALRLRCNRIGYSCIIAAA